MFTTKHDFTRITKNMHIHMCEAITNLLNIHDTKEVQFENNKTAKVIFDFDEGLAAINADAVGLDGDILEIREEESGVWYNIGHNGDVVLCSIYQIYELTHEALGGQCIYTKVDYDGKEYDCRVVYSTDVNISVYEKEPTVILIAPQSLNEAFEANDDFGCEVDEKVYFFTDDQNLNLPYKELCECLIKDGID